MPCDITVHVNLTDTEQTFMKLTLGDNFFFVNNFKTNFGANLANVLVIDRPQMDGHVLRTRLIFYFVKTHGYPTVSIYISNTFSLYLENFRLNCHGYTLSVDLEWAPTTQLTSLSVQQAEKEKYANCLLNVCGMHVSGCVQVTAALSLRNKTNLYMLCGWERAPVSGWMGWRSTIRFLRVSYRSFHIIRRERPELTHLILMYVTYV